MALLPRRMTGAEPSVLRGRVADFGELSRSDNAPYLRHFEIGSTKSSFHHNRFQEFCNQFHGLLHRNPVSFWLTISINIAKLGSLFIICDMPVLKKKIGKLGMVIVAGT